MRMLDKARSDILAILKKAGVKAAPADIVFPPNSEMGDLALPLFAAAKEKDVAPGKLTQEIAHTIKPNGLVERVEAAGPYINFWLKKGQVAEEILSDYSLSGVRGTRTKSKGFLKVGLRQARAVKPGRIMVEMVSPNNNKPLHLGHLRNAFLGESVSRLLETQGAKIVRACLFNDRGLHIAKAMVGYMRWAKGATPETSRMKGDQFVVQWYVQFEREAKAKPQLMEESEELVRKWEADDKETIALWKKMAGWANDGIMFSLKRLGIKFDTIYYESKLWEQGKKIVAEGLKKGVFKKDETGAVLVEFPSPPTPLPPGEGGRRPGEGLPPKVLLRSDGTAIYATSDLALTPEKFKKYKLDRAIWCVGQEQDLYLQQLFAIFKILGFKWADACEHLTYGLVNLPEGRMKTREGTVVEADPLLDYLVGLVEKEIKERHTHLTEREAEDRAEIIAQAAVRYYLLKVGPKQAVRFDPQASIAFTGDTGPYLLYTYARIASILRKANAGSVTLSGGRRPKSKGPAHKSTGSLASLRSLGMTDIKITNSEWSLVIELARFPEIITQTAQDRDPSHLAKYLFDLAQKFSTFYEHSPVLKAAEPTRTFRIALISTFQKTLKEGLRLLTIDTVEEM